MSIKVRCKQSPHDKSHDYFVSLLELALKKTPEDGPMEVLETDFNPPQGRALFELTLGRSINVDWAGTSIQSEKDLRPIRIPLIGGLLGYRVPVIRKELQKEFSAIRTLDDLRFYTAVQGEHWPDSDILESAGLKVYRVPSFHLMYDMLIHDRVDYFPRGINEVYAEVAEVGNENLTAFDSLLIAYRMPMYFFTSKLNEKLAQRIETGLRRAINDGSFRKHLETHPVTAPIFPLSKFDNAVIIPIANHTLPHKTPLDDPSLWIPLGKMPIR